MQAIIALRSRRIPKWREVSPAPVRFVTFLFIGMPFVFLSLIYLSALFMQYVVGWTHTQSVHFMASAFTGGAIVLPHDPPQGTLTKMLAAILGSAGVGMFGFLVAALLDSGMVEPIIRTCSLKLPREDNLGKYEKGVHIFVAFIKVAIFAVSINLTASFLFAGIMRLSEGWSWFQAVKAMISVGLGGGVVYRDMGTPHTEYGTFIFCVVSCWAIGTAALMIATAAEAFMENTAEFEVAFEKMVHTAEESATASTETMSLSRTTTYHESVQAASRISEYVGMTDEDYHVLGIFSGFVIACLPVALLAVMLYVASCMSAMTNWEFQNAFWVALPAVTGGAASLTANTNPQLTYWGAFVMFFSSSVGFLALNIAMGVGARFIGPFIQSRPYLNEKEGGVGFALAALFTICWVLIPITVFSLSAPLGGLIALAEDWPFVDGFWWCVAVQCGGGMALTDATIQHKGGMWIASVAVAWSIGISMVSIGLSGAPVVGPLMHAVGMNMQDELLALLPKSAPPRRHSQAVREAKKRYERAEEKTKEVFNAVKNRLSSPPGSPAPPSTPEKGR